MTQNGGNKVTRTLNTRFKIMRKRKVKNLKVTFQVTQSDALALMLRLVWKQLLLEAATFMEIKILKVSFFTCLGCLFITVERLQKHCFKKMIKSLIEPIFWSRICRKHLFAFCYTYIRRLLKSHIISYLLASKKRHQMISVVQVRLWILQSHYLKYWIWQRTYICYFTATLKGCKILQVQL